MKLFKATLISGMICSLLLSGVSYGTDLNSASTSNYERIKPSSALGLGERKATQKEIDWVKKNMSVNRPIHNNKLAVERINDELKIKGRPQIDPDTAVPIGEELSAQNNSATISTTYATGSTASIAVPGSVDNSTLSCFPPIGDQNPLGSCVAFATTYYQFTHMTGLLKNWDVKSDAVNMRKFSPGWTYNLCNYGADEGLYTSDAYRLLLDNGSVLWADFPYDNTNCKKWCLTNTSWTNAVKYRANETGYLQIIDSSSNNNTPVTSETDPDLNLVKNYLNNGYILTFATHIWSWKFKTISNNPSTTADDSYAGKYICYAKAINSGERYDGRHLMTIVGYNDNIWTDINGNGTVDAGEKGAFKIANSWGANSTSNMDNGYYYVSYDALNIVSSVSGAPTFYSRDVVFDNNVSTNTMYWVTAKESSNPSLLAKFTVSHSKRSQMEVEIGYSDTTTTTPVATRLYKALDNAGGGYTYNYMKPYEYDYAFDGTGDGYGSTICDGTFTLDFTDIVKQYNLATGTTKRWYLKVTDSLTDGKPVTVKNFSLINSSGTVLKTSGTISKTADGSSTTTYLDYALPTPSSVWVNKTNASIYRASAASTSYNGSIYIAGGYNENLAKQNTLLEYSPSSGSWTSKNTMWTPRVDAGAATLFNKIYVVGGYNTSALNSIEEYNPSTNTWTTKRNMNNARSCLGVAAANGKIYAIGGIVNGAVSGVVEEYDPTTDTWKTKTSMPTARDSFGIVSYNGKIYVIGGTVTGSTKLATVEVYDPLTDTWDTKASMPTARDGLACTAYNGKIYAIGGIQTGAISGKTEVYDIVSNTWTTSANLNNVRNLLNAASVNDKLYALFGLDNVSNVTNKVEEYTP
jgi:hypothetical protein